MNKVFDLKQQISRIEEAIHLGLEEIANNCIYSPWTDKNTGWQEQWQQSKFSGLYASSNALSLLLFDKDKYIDVINKACEGFKHLFDDENNYVINKEDDEEEIKR
ncbi:MAG: hypothetical protein J5666_08845 [Bacilli bacterium]|nr:hypothetical protein [Bacilli bacterium]